MFRIYFFLTGYGYVDFEDKTKVTGEFKGEGRKFNQRRLRFKLSDLPSGVDYKVRCYAYHDDTPDEIGESTTSFKIESAPEGGISISTACMRNFILVKSLLQSVSSLLFFSLERIFPRNMFGTGILTFQISDFYNSDDNSL